MLSRNGRVVVIGNRGTIEINPRDVMARDASILGMLLFNTPEEDQSAIYAAIGAALQSGVARPVIALQLPLGDAKHAHDAVLKPGHYGKIVLIP